MNKKDVIHNFTQQKTNRHGKVEGRAGNVFYSGRILYSYGHHFPLAVRLAPDLYLKNGDRYSVTTAKHQSLTQRACEGPTVSFTALRSAGVDLFSLDAESVVSVQPDVTIALEKREDKQWYRHRADRFTHGPDTPFTPPSQGMLVTQGDGFGYWDILSSCVLRVAGKNLLGCLDENKYCLIQLPAPVATTDEAFSSLMPEPVRHAVQREEKVLRQGEWFFIPHYQSDREMAAALGITQKELLARAIVAPLPGNGGNVHACRQVSCGGSLYASRNVRHLTTMGNRSGEHKTLKLGYAWYAVYKNTEIASWSTAGRFD